MRICVIILLHELFAVGNKQDDLILTFLRLFHKDQCAKRFGVVWFIWVDMIETDSCYNILVYKVYNFVCLWSVSYMVHVWCFLSYSVLIFVNTTVTVSILLTCQHWYSNLH